MSYVRYTLWLIIVTDVIKQLNRSRQSLYIENINKSFFKKNEILCKNNLMFVE